MKISIDRVPFLFYRHAVTATETPIERFVVILEWLKKAIAAANAVKMPGEWVVLMWNRVSTIIKQVTRIATLLKEGKFTPRQRSGKPRKPSKPSETSPWLRSPFPRKAGWMLRMIPGAAGPRGWLETLLADPEMVALMATAPPALVRPIRTLCHMLLIEPPPVLPRRRPTPLAPEPAPQEAAPAAAPPASGPPDPPGAALAPSSTAFNPLPPPARAPPRLA